jgi:hypothetical protein
MKSHSKLFSGSWSGSCGKRKGSSPFPLTRKPQYMIRIARKSKEGRRGSRAKCQRVRKSSLYRPMGVRKKAWMKRWSKRESTP